MDNNSYLASPVCVLSTGDDDNNDTSSYTDRRNATITHVLNQQPSRPYPPVVRVGFVDPHDQPYFQYGHKDKPTIAREIDLHLEGPPSGSPLPPPNPPRFHSQSFAITCWTNVSKEEILGKIVQEFGHPLLQYACVASEIAGTPPRQHLHIQIILKRKINKKSWFLDKHTLVHCNYQVTKNNCAWNEYIKKDDHDKDDDMNKMVTSIINEVKVLQDPCFKFPWGNTRKILIFLCINLRYKDEIIFTWNSNMNELQSIVKQMTISHTIINIELQIGTLYSRIDHDHETQSYTLPYAIGNSKVTHSHWLQSSLIRAVRYCTSIEDFNREIIHLDVTRLTNGY
ncbi:unnamed protein product [Rotaria socialis]|uniref:Replication-associated protein n=1 Tax=Rotaria socialis TaxID=392032 RepID=A0A820QAG8_9BILA|nr:unnamed protein product [Rotaria socialis]CAF4492315.1 unnamed protein product [Rotaria socialis]CAF4765549.1 unnamed protein product [Rotaria socialis]